MSLFKTADFWSLKCGIGGEKFASSCLVVAHFLSRHINSHQIVCGSLSGRLRMFAQRNYSDSSEKRDHNAAVNSDGDTNPFSIVNCQNEIDICMEIDLKMPIIQIASGKFIMDRIISLAVLTPQKLIMMVVDEESMSFKMMEEFIFQRTAYNFCHGNFGRVSDRDFVCVQSTDATLSFYVNGHLSFITYLASALIPGPVAYGHDDSIVVVSASRFVEGYKYKNLAVSQSSGPSSSQKRALPDWSVNIGETAIDICMCDSNKEGTMVVILSRYCFIIINNNTGAIVKKRFETRLRSLLSYGDARFLVTNMVGELMIFQGTSLRWKASMTTEDVVGVSLGQFNGLSNFVVTVTETGLLSVIFLGTEPSTGTGISIPATRRDMVSEDQDLELDRLQQKIRTITTTSQGTSSAVRVKAKESRSFLKVSTDLSSARLILQDGGAPSYSVDVHVKSSVDVCNVLVRLCVRRPLMVKETCFQLPSVATDHDLVRTVSVTSSGAMVVCSLRLLVFVTYQLEDDQSVVTSRASLNLPLGLVLQGCAPCKQASFKVTLDTNEASVSLRQIFPDLLFQGTGDTVDHSDVALGLRYYNGGPTVTILASGTSKRYRLQSDHFEALWLVTKELKTRLSQHFGPRFSMTYSEPLPLDPYFLVLDFHFSIRQNLGQFTRLLEERSRQFRAIEKLLLTKTKDKAETSLHNLEMLLENSLTQLLHLSELVEEQQLHLAIVGTALSSSTSLLGFLLQSSCTNMSESQKILINSALSGTTQDFPDLGLEELYGVIYVHLLRQVGGKDPQTLSMPPLEIPDNIEKLKKHVRVLCDRVCQGVQLRVVAIDSEDLKEGGEENFGDDLKFIRSPRVSGTKNKSKKSKKKQGLTELVE